MHLTVTVKSVTKKTQTYAMSEHVLVGEMLDFEIGPDVRHMTLLLYTGNNEGENWEGSAEISILSTTKGVLLDKTYSVDLTNKKGRFLGGRLDS